MMKSLLRVPSLGYQQVRTLLNYKHNKKYMYPKEGKKIDYITFFPRDGASEDPPIEPAKLFRVERIKPVKGNPYWERRILRDLGLIEKGKYVTVVKNIPENNQRLWKIKHLIHITPITFPHGEPTKEDVNYTFLKENGECLVAKKIEVDPQRLEATEQFEKDPVRLDKAIVKRELRMRWLSGWDWKP